MGAYAQGATYLVEGGTTFALNALVQRAQPTDTVRVRGKLSGPTIVVDRSLVLIGEEAEIVGDRSGSVIEVNASKVIIQGFRISGTGRSSIEDHAGIKVTNGTDVHILNNTFDSCFFGVLINGCRSAWVKGNVLRGNSNEEVQEGNAIHIWKGDGVRIDSNLCLGHRDGIYLEFVGNSLIRGNQVRRNARYGLHFMFSNNDDYSGNWFEMNGAGVAVMYSKQIGMLRNTFKQNRGASAYGLLLKEINDAVIQDNVFLDNTTGMLVDGCNRVHAANNQFRSNGWALRLFSNSTGCRFEGNVFTGNTFDMSTNGELMLNDLTGNYWDRYSGYDLDRDGRGDTPYRPLGLFSLLVERMPYAVVFSRSLFVSLLDQAERLIPTLSPEAMKDDRPLMRPPRVDG